jgi:hypothetical protein
MLGAAGYGTYAAIFMQNALAAGDAFLRPGCSLFEDADKRRIKTGILGLQNTRVRIAGILLE